MFDSAEVKSLRKRVENLEGQVNDLIETVANETQLRMEAELKMKMMRMHQDSSKTDLIALNIASGIEDIFARGYNSVAQRKAMIQLYIIQLIRNILVGGKDC